jgi:DNA-binding transcriptional LysR family regulator
MDLRQLRGFVTIVEAGGFLRAADRVHLSQPALSRQIHALEAELGVRLFDRIGRRVRLTSEGEDLLALSRRLLTDAESLGERARALKSGRSGLLRVDSSRGTGGDTRASRCIWSRMAARGFPPASSGAM